MSKISVTLIPIFKIYLKNIIVVSRLSKIKDKLASEIKVSLQ
jgi:hypothetical protein